MSGVKRLIQEEGVEGIVSTLPVIWTKTIPYTMFQLATYDVTSSALRSWANGQSFEPPSIALQLPAALLAAVIASLASQPGDTLMSTFNGECPDGAEECPGFDFVEGDELDEDGRCIPKRRGASGDGDGFGAGRVDARVEGAAAHTSLIVVIQLTVYDDIKRALFR